MAAFDTTRPMAASPASAGGLMTRIANLYGTLAAWNDARMTRKSLSKLTARELEDIGLSLSDIDNMNWTRRSAGRDRNTPIKKLRG